MAAANLMFCPLAQPEADAEETGPPSLSVLAGNRSEVSGQSQAEASSVVIATTAPRKGLPCLVRLLVPFFPVLKPS